MKKIILAVISVLLIYSCSTQENLSDQQIIEQQNQKKDEKKLLTRSEIDAIIAKSIQNTGDFKWVDQTVHVIYSALVLENNILSVGYDNVQNRTQQGVIDVKNDLIKTIQLNEPKQRSTSKNQVLYSYDEIKTFDITVTSIETIESLLKDSRVRYIEPAAYTFGKVRNANERSALDQYFGCGYATNPLKTRDYTKVAPGALVPWAFYKHNIPAAWRYASGKGITLAIVDSGLTPENTLMSTNFNDGYSRGRTLEKYGTYVDSWFPWVTKTDGVNDKCGHGTSMASIATAPRNNNNMPVGVAYNANLITYRATTNVVLLSYQQRKGVANALIALANRRDVKVISMSLGFPFGIDKVRDAVRYAYNRGKLIFSAAGTSTVYTNANTFGVIFPASMKETVAVTGVKENKTTTSCAICHSGKEVDFTFQMERASGSKLPILSYYNDKTTYIGGSSAATAATAGIAALVWSRYPNWSRDQVLNKMKRSAEFYPNKNPEYGYGNIDVLKAVK